MLTICLYVHIFSRSSMNLQWKSASLDLIGIGRLQVAFLAKTCHCPELPNRPKQTTAAETSTLSILGSPEQRRG